LLHYRESKYLPFIAVSKESLCTSVKSQFEKGEAGSIPAAASCPSGVARPGPADTHMCQGDLASADPAARHPTAHRGQGK